MMCRRISASFVLTLIALTNLGCQGDNASRSAAPTVVRIAHLRIGSDLPYYVGVSKGIFSKHGLDVEGQRFGDSNQVIQAVVEGRTDATDVIGSLVVLQEALRSPGVFQIHVASAAGPGQDIHQLIARTDAKISGISGLVGRKLGVFPGSQMRMYAQLVLSKYLDRPSLDSVELVPLSPPQQIDAIRSGQIDAVLTLEPTGTELVLSGLGYRVASNLLYEEISKPDPFVTAFGLIRNGWARDHPEAARSLVAAYREIASMIANPGADVRAILVSDLGVSEQVAGQASLYQYLVPPPMSVIEASTRLLVEKKVLPQAPDLSSLIYRDR